MSKKVKKVKGEDIEIIKLTIIKCSIENDTWYKKQIGKKRYFFNYVFKDYNDNESIWLATVPTSKYAYLEDTNYKTQIRKAKLRKIKKSGDLL